MPLPSTLADLYKALKAELRAYAPDSADLEARWILEKRMSIRWSDIIASPEKPVDSEKISLIENDMKARAAGQPLSRIYGAREFWGLEFTLNEATLDPRPDTETVIRRVLDVFIDRNAVLEILDLGTGTGCLLLAVLSEYKNAQGLGVDLAPRALEAAVTNAARLGLAERASFGCGSWFDAVPAGAAYDLILSNPPYIRESVIPELERSVQNHDPILALSGGADGLDAYKNIFLRLGDFLKPAGAAFFEIGFDQADDVVRLARNAGFSVQGVFPDSAGLARVVEIRHGDKL